MVLRLFGAALIGEGVWRRMKTRMPKLGAMSTLAANMVLTKAPACLIAQGKVQKKLTSV